MDIPRRYRWRRVAGATELKETTTVFDTCCSLELLVFLKGAESVCRCRSVVCLRDVRDVALEVRDAGDLGLRRLEVDVVHDAAGFCQRCAARRADARRAACDEFRAMRRAVVGRMRAFVVAGRASSSVVGCNTGSMGRGGAAAPRRNRPCDAAPRPSPRTRRPRSSGSRTSPRRRASWPGRRRRARRRSAQRPRRARPRRRGAGSTAHVRWMQQQHDSRRARHGARVAARARRRRGRRRATAAWDCEAWALHVHGSVCRGSDWPAADWFPFAQHSAVVVSRFDRLETDSR